MVVKKGEIATLVEQQVASKVVAAESILDAILKINSGYADIMLGVFRHQEVREQIERDYVTEGWDVTFIMNVDGPNYFVTIKQPSTPPS